MDQTCSDGLLSYAEVTIETLSNDTLSNRLAVQVSTWSYIQQYHSIAVSWFFKDAVVIVNVKLVHATYNYTEL